MAGMFAETHAGNTSMGGRRVLPKGVMRYSTATGRVDTTSRSTTPFRSSRRSVAVSDFYVTRWSPEKIGDFMAGAEAVTEEIGLPLPTPPASLIGVEYLFDPDVLVEVEAAALLD